MAMGPKDWVFVYEAIEEVSRALYLHGYNDAKAKKNAETPDKIRLNAGAKMRLQTMHAQITKGR